MALRASVRVSHAATVPAAPPLLVQGKGRWRGNPFTLRGGPESPL
jgi:hypothetical protein